MIDPCSSVLFRSLWARDETAIIKALRAVARRKEPPKREGRSLLLQVTRAIGYVNETRNRAGPLQAITAGLSRLGSVLTLMAAMASVIALVGVLA